MAIWLFRAGGNGEYEQKFLDDNRVYLTWNELDVDLMSFNDKSELYTYLEEEYEDCKRKKAINWGSQIWPIAHSMKMGDWIVLPSKMDRTIHFGEIVSEYHYDIENGNPYYHYRDVKWFALDIPRDNFDQDLLYSFGAFMTVCRIHRNNAEDRIRNMRNNNWNSNLATDIINYSMNDELEESDSSRVNFEELITDNISKYIQSKFKGHKMEKLIAAILKAKGFTTYVSPEGPDNGGDIIAGRGVLGFESPRICVEVKSHDAPVDRPTLDRLVGAMSHHKADYGLLISWSGFKQSVKRTTAEKFFQVRLWDSQKVIEELFEVYDQLDPNIRAEIPLKSVWMLSGEDN